MTDDGGQGGRKRGTWTKAQLQQLLDIEAIKQLKARYFRLMDLKQWDDWGLVFAQDCVMEVPEADMVNNGREEIVTRREPRARRRADRVTTVTCPRSRSPAMAPRGASGRCSTTSSGPAGRRPALGLQGYGHYQRGVRPRRRGVAHRRLERLRIDPLG